MWPDKQRLAQIQGSLRRKFYTISARTQFDALVRVASLSDYFLNYLVTNPAARALVQSGDLTRSYRVGAIAGHWSTPGVIAGAINNPKQFDARLRQMRHREMARIIFRDFLRLADMVETTRDLSALADLCIGLALKHHYDSNCARYGVPTSIAGVPQQMCVLALGKLGAKELNLSSDVDLVFFYDAPGTVSNLTKPSPTLSNNAFFLRTARQIIKSLDDIQADGFVFRVDMRLRPYGESGALILHRAAMEKYFVEQGRDWERYAYIKARVSAGDMRLGASFLHWLTPFVYRKHLDYGAIEALRDMKHLIDNEIAHRSLKQDIKLGSGGIREIEFIVQAHQLIWGGKKPHFRHNRLLEALDVLASEGHLPTTDVDSLRQAYVFLRNSEHAIQGAQDRQTQQLPEDALGQQRLAAVMGFDAYPVYLHRLQQHRSRVSACFAKLMRSNHAEEILVEGQLFWVTIWNDLGAPASSDLLASHGFNNVSTLIQALGQLKDTVQGVQGIGFDRIQRLVPLLLSLSAAEAQPTETLSRLIAIMHGIIRRAIYVAFLLENMDALRRLVHLCGMSPWVAERIKAHPIIMYALTDKRTDAAQMDAAALTDELNQMLAPLPEDDLEAHMDALRQFKHTAMLKVAVFELLNLLPTMQASDCLTCIAELILNKAMDLAFTYLLGRHGEPCDKHGYGLGRCFAIIAYGKLGGIELAYGSDLDIVFLHDADLHGNTNGDKPVANNVFFSRLGQRLIHILTSLTGLGTLYQVDLRLRPDGIKGPLVSRFSAFARYLENHAWTWELQALVRARHVAGAARYKQKFEALRQRILSAPRDPAVLRPAVSNMREKMRKNIKRNASQGPAATDDIKHLEQVLMPEFDFKQGAGAIIDIEFLVQYLLLLHCHTYPDLCRRTDKVRLLAQLQRRGLLDKTQCKLLTDAYLAYRSAVHYTWLGGQVSSFEQLNAYRSQVMAIWNEKLLV